MTDQPPTPPQDPHPDPVVRANQERIARALEEIDQLNRVTGPQGMAVGIDQGTVAHTATLDALVRLLIEAGLVDEQELVRRKSAVMANAFESAVEEAREIRRTISGLVVPGSAAG